MYKYFFLIMPKMLIDKIKFNLIYSKGIYLMECVWKCLILNQNYYFKIDM